MKSKASATPSHSLTPPQRDILAFIRERCESGQAPSYREIQAQFGYKAVGTVQDHVKALIRKGLLEKPSSEGRRARSLVPCNPAPPIKAARLPVYGEIAAGSARDSVQIEIGSLVISAEGSKRPDFALRVVGDSMVGAGIFEGDFLFVERTPDARTGDIVVALLNGETTVKRYLEKKGRVFLVPENPRLQPIAVEGENFSIQGKVIGLQRRI